MPLFQIAKGSIKAISQSTFDSEKALQKLVENNLEALFDFRFIASEFSTGAKHAGRIDTLALSEDDNPVIIEYKNVASSELVIQSLFYLAWLNDHRGDFEIAAQRALGNDVRIDWSDIRVICIAPTYKKYDVHAVETMGSNIELWTYRRFKNDTFLLEELLRAEGTSDVDNGRKNPVMVIAGKKAAITRRNGQWTIEQHLSNKPEKIRELVESFRDFIGAMDSKIEESPKKLYIANRTTQNIVCLETRREKLLMYVKLDPKKYSGPKGITRDVTGIGHYGTGHLEITVRNERDFEAAKPAIRAAYEKMGG